MSTPPRNLPRFLPTLTEVVHPGALTHSEVPASPGLEDTVWFVMQRVDLVMERRLREEAETMLRTVVAEHVQSLSIRLRQELETVVRQAVSDALALGVNQIESK